MWIVQCAFLKLRVLAKIGSDAPGSMHLCNPQSVQLIRLE